MNTNISKHINIIAGLQDLMNQQKTIVKLERKIIFSDSDIDIFKNIDNDILNQYIDLLSNTSDSESKNKLLDFLQDNKITLAKITDNKSDWQIAIIKIESDNKINYLINKNLDLSYGQQSENPRLKRSALLNAFINYDFKTKKLLNNDIVFINDIIASGYESNNIDFFNGNDIKDAGFFDTRDNTKQKTIDKSNDLSFE